ncbi:MAG: hypothetical protein JSU68_11900, partial [Phycisphaerales bacterium]
YHSLGLKANGSIVGWGSNGTGQCDVPAPNTDFVAVVGSWWHSLGLKADGSIVIWGRVDPDRDSGQCDVPAPNTDFAAVAGGPFHSLGIKSCLRCVCGDIDRSGGPVDLNDFATFALCFGLAGPAGDCSADDFACSDLDGSGDVALSDFATFALWFGLQSSQYPPDCEP